MALNECLIFMMHTHAIEGSVMLEARRVRDK
ncbi:protein of unknown function (plasmid) [Caballeronia sp. S22]